MRICVFGLGYVGTVTAASLAGRGHSVVAVDVDAIRVAMLGRGEATVVEPGLDELLAEGLRAARLSATTDVRAALTGAEIAVVCVGTPAGEDGHSDLRQVRAALAAIGENRDPAHPLTVLLRSTVPPGSTASVEPILDGRPGLELVFYPEFLREGSAVADFRTPSLAVVGTHDGGEPSPRVREIAGADAVVTNWATAECVKYACNAFHATKVAFANELGRIGKSAGIDSRAVMDIVCRDRVLNISPAYLRPGNPFGGSCFPKDVLALSRFAESRGVAIPLIASLLPSNGEHARRLREMALRGDERELALIGLSFKAGSDDLRGSSMLELARHALAAGRTVRVFDPAVRRGLPRCAGADAPWVARLCRDRIADALGTGGLVVASQRCLDAAELARHLTPHHRILDVNGWPELRKLPVPYEGFCW
jgi:GDP-mannose 6-dehydrogenase